MTAPEPPPGGWTIAEAAAALLPQKHAEAAKPPPTDWWMVGGTYRKRERDDLRLSFRRLMEGKRYVADGVPFGKAEPEEIPALHWRSATFHLGLPSEPELLSEFSVGMHSWSGVRIKRAHAAVMAAPVGQACDDRLPAGGSELSELPAWWSLDQACVWIALRDTAAVLDAGKPTHRRETLGIIGWHLKWALRKGDQAVGPNPSEADDLIVAVARRGAIQSSGRRSTDPERRPIETEDWALVNIAEDRHGRGGKYLAPEGDGIHHWRGVLMARDDMVREWPPFGSERNRADLTPAEPTPNHAVELEPHPDAKAPTGAPKRATYSDQALRGWFMLRVASWPVGAKPPSEAECVAAARAYFAEPISRSKIREAREDKTPKSWRTRGPKVGE